MLVDLLRTRAAMGHRQVNVVRYGEWMANLRWLFRR